MRIVDRIWVAFAALNGAIAVGAGAYASHGLAGDPRAQDLFRLAGQYQMWHALALIAVVALSWRAEGLARLGTRIAGWLFVAGVVLFSGTLYALALTGPLPVGMTAPLGGTALMAGWAVLAAVALLFGRGFLGER